jgi:hypothetical protein
VQVSLHHPEKKMKIALFLALFVGVAVADPRGSRSVRGRSTRKLQMDMAGGGKDQAGGGADKDAEGGDTEAASGIVETHPCMADGQAALNWLGSVAGASAASDQSCFADPVNGCEGGCCRLGNWLVCDTENNHPALPCICNGNTAPVIDVLTPGNATMTGNATTTGNTTEAPLTPEEFAALYPEVVSAIALQESAPLPNGDTSTATPLVDAEDADEEPKKDQRVRINMNA